MKNVNELKQFIENANPLTQWHVTVFQTFCDLHKIKVEQTESELILTEPNGVIIKIKN